MGQVRAGCICRRTCPISTRSSGLWLLIKAEWFSNFVAKDRDGLEAPVGPSPPLGHGTPTRKSNHLRHSIKTLSKGSRIAFSYIVGHSWAQCSCMKALDDVDHLFPLTDRARPTGLPRLVPSHSLARGSRLPALRQTRPPDHSDHPPRSACWTTSAQHCGKVYNLFTGPHHPVTELYAIVRGVAQDVSTRQLSRERGCGYQALLDLRHKLQG